MIKLFDKLYDSEKVSSSKKNVYYNNDETALLQFNNEFLNRINTQQRNDVNDYYVEFMKTNNNNNNNSSKFDEFLFDVKDKHNAEQLFERLQTLTNRQHVARRLTHANQLALLIRTNKNLFESCDGIVDVFTGQCWRVPHQFCGETRATNEEDCFEIRWPLALATTSSTTLSSTHIEARTDAAFDAHLSFAVSKQCSKLVKNLILQQQQQQQQNNTLATFAKQKSCVYPIKPMRGDLARLFLYVRLRHYKVFMNFSLFGFEKIHQNNTFFFRICGRMLICHLKI